MQRKYDLIVVGGGFAGVCAAIEAAKKGVQVLLVEKYNCLGGAAANCLVMPFMNYYTKIPNTDKKEYLTGDLFIEILKEIEQLGGMKGISFDFDEEIIKLVLNRMCIKYGVNLLFNTVVTDAVCQNEKIISVNALGKSKKLELFADYYIDATGDGELSALAGCAYTLGREKDSLCQPMTLCFRMSGVDKDKFRKNWDKINPLYNEYKKKGLIKNPRENVLIFSNFNDGVLHFNTTRIVKKILSILLK